MIQFDIDKMTHSLDEVRTLLDPRCMLHLGKEAKDRIAKCRNYLDERMKNQKAPIYGVTTGFGSLCNVSVDKDQLSQLQKNLVMSHACGVGEEVRPEIVRLMIALKVKSLSYGYSGVRVETVERLVDFFNEGVTPVVYQQGSLGASGDLAPLANMCLPLLGLGEFDYKGKRYPGCELESMFGWKPLTLASKEGLALLNGTQFMLAHAVWCIIRAEHISAAADKIATVSLEAFNGRKEPFTPGVHAVRPHKGQMETARVILNYLQGSQLIDGPGKEVQDPYSFRCVPQVHGASKDAISYVESVFMNDRGQQRDRQPDRPPRRGSGHLRRQLPRTAVVDFPRLPGDSSGRARFYLGTPYLSAHLRQERLAVIPGGQVRSQLRLYDTSVCRRFCRQPEQTALYSLCDRYDRFVSGTGGPRQHGCQCRYEVCACR